MNCKFRISGILAVFVLADFAWSYVASGADLGDSWRMFGSSLIIALGFWIAKKFAPDAFARTRESLVSSRASSFLGFRSLRKYFVIACLCLPFAFLSYKASEIQAEIVGKGFYESDPVDQTLSSASNQASSEIDQKAYLVAVGKNLTNLGLAALLEELLYRALVLRLLIVVMPIWGAGLLSSLLFGLAHVPARLGGTLAFASYQIVPTFILGLFQSLAYTKLGLGASVVFHIWNNVQVNLASENFDNMVADAHVFLYLTLVPLFLVQFFVEYMFRKFRSRRN